jgi:sugar lactone lactonase YvrE
MGFVTISQGAIMVGPAGTGTITFDTAPATADWSTLSVAGGAGTYEGAAGTLAMDANFKTKAASAINGALGTDPNLTPATLNIAAWNTNGFLQTKPTGNDYNILMATLQNNSGATLSSLNVSYTFVQDPLDPAGSINGHRAFFSTTGQPGCWQAIPEFTSVAAGTLSATLALGSWTNGATLYIAWADDNGTNPDAGNEIDSFSATPGAAPVAQWCWSNFAGSLTANGDADGGPGTSLFTQLYGIATGPSDNLFVTDRGTGKLKQITPAGVVSTIGSFAGLIELKVNKVNGNIYFTQNNSAVYKLVPPYTAAPTVWSTHNSFGVGVDSATDTVYVPDFNTHQIFKVTSGGVETLLAGSGASGSTDGSLTNATFNFPTDIAVDPTGNILYVVDRNASVIRKIDIAGDSVTTVAGTANSDGCVDDVGAAARFRQPTGIDLGPDGNLYVADQDNFSVRKVTLPAGAVTLIGGACQVSGAQDGCATNTRNGFLGQVAVDSAGNVYTADRGDQGGAPGAHARVSKGTPPAAAISLVITSISRPDAPGTPAQYCWTNYAGSLTADGCVDGVGNAARFSQIYGIDINGAGDTLFVADRTCGKISKVTVPGAQATTLASGFSLVMLVVNKVNGNVYFPDLNDGAIKKLEPPNYDTATVVAAGPGFGNGLAVDSQADTVYASKTGENQIYKIENAGSATPGAATLFAGIGTNPEGTEADGTLLGCSLSRPMGGWVVGTGSTATLYWATRVPGRIRKIDITGDSVTTVAGSSAGRNDGTGTTAQFDQPHNVAVGPDGNLYVADQQGGTIRKVTLPGAEVTTIGGVYSAFAATEGCGTNALNGQLGQLTVDASGNIWTGDRAGVGSAHARVSRGVLVPGLPGGPGPNIQVDFTAPTAAPCSFTLQCATDVGGPYADCGTVTQLGANSYRALVPIGGNTQFYRIKQ